MLTLPAELTYCLEHPGTCENEGKCISLSREDGGYRCHCRQGFLGKNCEIRDDFLLTSVAPPRITPPTPTELDVELDVEAGVPDDSLAQKLPAGNEPERRTNDTAAVATAGAGAGAMATNITSTTGAGSHNATNEALSAVTTRRATTPASATAPPPSLATSGEKAVKGNATSVAEALPPPPPTQLTNHEQTKATLAPAATAVTSHRDEEDEDDDDEEDDEDEEEEEDEDEDEYDEEDDSDQLIPNII